MYLPPSSIVLIRFLQCPQHASLQRSAASLQLSCAELGRRGNVLEVAALEDMVMTRPPYGYGELCVVIYWGRAGSKTAPLADLQRTDG